jgi:predicted  nucleic acid-binding Zn-ribbon protein
MCGGGGGSSPPPDYTSEKASYAATENQKRKAQADAYNASAKAFSDKLSGTVSQARNLKNSYGGYTIKDYNNFSNAEKEVNSLLGSLSSMNFSDVRPNYESVVQSPYGAVSVDTPSLMSVDYSDRDAAQSELRSLLGQFNNLRNDYRGEEDKIRQSGQKLSSGIAGLKSGLSRASIADLNALNEYQRQLDQYKAEVGSFYSPIADITTIDDTYLNQANSEFGGLEASLKDLFSKRTAEEERIKAYEKGILEQADKFNADLGGYTIADEDKINALQKSIDDYQRQAGRFSSLLNFDLTDELGNLQGVEDSLGALTSKREAELKRIKDAQDKYFLTANDIARAARTSSIYDQGYIDDIRENASQLRDEIGRFSSVLPADFARVLSQIDAADSATSSLESRRNAALDRIQSRFDSAIAGAGDIAGYDEAALRDRLYRLGNIDTELSRFAGGRADDIATQIASGVEQIDTRLRDLSTRRSQLEQQAQKLLATVQSASYTTGDQAAAGISEAEKLKSEIDLYNAQQAIDEISSIMERLNAEKSRLANDASAVAARQQAEQDQILRAIQGLGGDTGVVGAGMTAQEYLALLQKKKQEDDAAKQAAAISAFSSALGVAA